MNKGILIRKRLLMALIVSCVMVALAFSALTFVPKMAVAQAIDIWDGSQATTFSGGNGSEATPFLIADGSELSLLSKVINDTTETLTVDGNVISNAALRTSHYKLTADIKLNDTTNWEGWSTVAAPANRFNAIGYIQTSPTTKHNYFSGVFDGDSHTIAGLFNVGVVSGSPVGLFGLIYGADIKNVGIIESSIFGHNIVGAIVSCVYLDESIADADRLRSKITNCFNNGNVTGTDIQVGGIVGLSMLVTIKDCYNTGTITGTSVRQGVSGGIAGSSSRNVRILNCYNTGVVTSIGDKIGGIIGTAGMGTDIIECYNTAEISGIGGVGGIYGSGDIGYGKADTRITKCYNTGNINSTTGSVGGIAASIAGFTNIESCYNTGNIKSASGNYAGGIVGNNAGTTNNPSTIYNSFNKGKIECGGMAAGGIAGNNSYKSEIINCYNTGDVVGSKNLSGGIVAVNLNDGSIIENCYNSGKVSGTSNVGAVVGNPNNSTTIKNNYYLTGCAKDGSTTVQNGFGNASSGLITADSAGVVTKFAESNNGSNGGKDGDGEFDPAITVDSNSNVTSLLAALNTSVEANNAVTADKYFTWYQGKVLSSYPDFVAAQIFTMTFNSNGGADSVMTTQNFTDKIAQNIKANTFTKALHNFSGWNTAADGGGTAYTAGQSVTLERNITLYAQWTAFAQYTITYNANTGTGAMDSQTFYEEMAQNIIANTFANTGHTFSGWNTAADGGGTAYTEEQSVTLEENITLYAQWTALAQYTITYNANTGTGAMDNQTFYEETAQNISANAFAKTWYKFSGWNTAADGGGTAYTAGQSALFSGDGTLYAQWELLQQYKVTYNANGGSGAMDTQIFVEGSAQPILTTNFAKDGYSFVGWNTAANGSGTAYAVGQSATIVADVTLYAQWKTKFVVSFDSNNGTGLMDSQTFLEAIEQAIAGNGFTRDGYEFKGWNTAADGSGKSYTNAEVLLLSANTTLFAQWALVAVAVKDTCNFHWFVFAWIALYMVISLLFYVLFKNVKLLQVITWAAYVLGLIISVFFSRCGQCWALWVIGIMFAIIALILFLFIKKDKKEDPEKDEPLPIDAVNEKIDEPKVGVIEQSNEQVEKNEEIIGKTLEEYLVEQRENMENSEDALEYLSAEKAKEQKLLAKGEGEQLLLQALEILFAELEKEERKGLEKLNRLKEERKNAEVAAKQQSITVLAIVENELENENDAVRKSILAILHNELIQEEADRKISDNVSEGEDLPSQKELVQINAQREQDRLKYIEAKRSGVAIILPIAFRLSREDVIDFMAKCKEKFSCTEKDFSVFEKDFDESEQLFPVETNMKSRTSPKMVDSLRCGDWCFSMMYERKDVIKFIMRMDDAYAEKLKSEHLGIKRSLFPKGENWYDVVIDGSFGSKKEIFAIMYHCYVYVLNQYYKLNNSICTTDTAAAMQDEKTVSKQIKDNENTVDPELEAVIAEKNESEKFYFTAKMPIEMSRRRILNYVQNSQPKTADIVERERLSSPSSLKINGKTYAMVYQAKAIVRMIVKLEDDYAEMISLIHPLIRRAKFPRGASWYVVEIDCSYTSTRQVYTLLTKSRNFVESTNKKAKAAKK